MMTAACKLKEDATMKDAQAGEAARIKEMTANKALVSVYKLTPYIANTPYDIVYLVVHSDLTAFAKAGTMQMTSKNWQVSSQKFASAMQCETALYSTSIVHLPSATR